MSTHYIHRYRYTHEKRKKFFKYLLRTNKAVIKHQDKKGILIVTTNGKDYRISNRGNVVEV